MSTIGRRTRKSEKEIARVSDCALCCGILGYVAGWLACAAMYTREDFPIIGDALRVLTPAPATLWILRGAGGLFCVLSFVFGLFGLIRSARRPPKIAGIILSGVGLFAGAICGYEVLMSLIFRMLP